MQIMIAMRFYVTDIFSGLIGDSFGVSSGCVRNSWGGYSGEVIVTFKHIDDCTLSQL